MLFAERFNSAEQVVNADMQPVGVIDIGSNSVRLVVYEGPLRAPTPVFNEKELCGLGRHIASSGRLGDDAVNCALTTLRRFRGIADVLNVSILKVIATAAVRDAEDGKSFIKEAEKVCRVPVQILTGEEEARISAQGVMMGVPDADGIAADLGGGSVELVDIKQGKIRRTVTLPLGGLRLIDMTGGKIEKAAGIIDQALAEVPLDKNWARPDVLRRRRHLARVRKMYMASSDYPLNVMHEFDLPSEEALAFAEKLRKSKRLATLPGNFEISKPRKEVLPYGALLMERLLPKVKPHSVLFSLFGVREGIFYSLLDKEEQAKDPPPQLLQATVGTLCKKHRTF